MKKKRHSRLNEKTSGSRWLISYADFITLLFAFFVVMYSVSSVNDGKYRKFSESIEATFDNPMKNIEPLSIGKLTKFLSKHDSGELSLENNTINNPTDENVFSQEIPLDLLEEKAKEKFKGLIKDGRVTMRRQENYVEIEIKSSMLFYEGGASLKKDSAKVIYDLAEVFKEISNYIVVEGFTDNKPISTELFPSNWELSATRSTVIIRKLIELGIPANRLSSMAFGANFPVDTNETDQGRKNNRRVTFIVERKSSRMQELEDMQYKNKISTTEEFIPPEIEEEVLTEGEEVVPEGDSIAPIIGDDGSLQFNARSIR